MRPQWGHVDICLALRRHSTLPGSWTFLGCSLGSSKEIFIRCNKWKAAAAKSFLNIFQCRIYFEIKMCPEKHLNLCLSHKGTTFCFHKMIKTQLIITSNHRKSTSLSLRCDSVAGSWASSTQLVPVHPVLAWDQLLQRDEGFSQQRCVLPECTITENSQVDHPLVQVTLRDAFIHQLTANGMREKKKRASWQLITATGCCTNLSMTESLIMGGCQRETPAAAHDNLEMIWVSNLNYWTISFKQVS